MKSGDDSESAQLSDVKGMEFCFVEVDNETGCVKINSHRGALSLAIAVPSSASSSASSSAPSASRLQPFQRHFQLSNGGMVLTGVESGGLNLCLKIWDKNYFIFSRLSLEIHSSEVDVSRPYWNKACRAPAMGPKGVFASSRAISAFSHFARAQWTFFLFESEWVQVRT